MSGRLTIIDLSDEADPLSPKYRVCLFTGGVYFSLFNMMLNVDQIAEPKYL